MAWSRAEDEVRAFIERTRLPFLASPMGKGVMDDGHALSVGAARSLALREADVVFLMGARLNWIMHFGLPPRFSKDVRVIQLDLHPEEIGTNVPTEVALPGDGRAVVAQLNEALKSRQWFYPDDAAWRSALAESAAKNQTTIAPMLDDDAVPMNYYRALRDIREWMPEDAIIVSEGANTMDIGRTQLPNAQPRKRLDAGTYGTMGVGLGFAIAAAVACPDQPVVAVEGELRVRVLGDGGRDDLPASACPSRRWCSTTAASGRPPARSRTWRACSRPAPSPGARATTS